MSAIPLKCDDCGYCLSNGSMHKCNHDYGEDIVIVSPELQLKECPIRDDKLDSVRIRAQYRNENFYIVVVLKERMPYEIFVEHATNGAIALQYMMASMDTITRLTSMSLRKYPLEKVVRQIGKSSRTKGDIAGLLSSILGKWIKDK